LGSGAEKGLVETAEKRNLGGYGGELSLMGAVGECLWVGLPVIAYDIESLKESIVDGQTGFLLQNKNPAKIAEKVEFFFDNGEEITRMGKAARSHVEQNFTWEKHVNQLLGIYEKTIRKRK
jgi:glycosyltransferase involved in cell wall biosynthesis